MLKENSIEIIRLEDKKLNNPLIFNYYIYLFLGKFVMNLSTLTAISPIDGRYHPKTLNLTNFFSEYALIRYRLIVEIRWLQSLCENSEITEAFPLTEQENDFLEKIIDNFDETEYNEYMNLCKECDEYINLSDEYESKIIINKTLEERDHEKYRYIDGMKIDKNELYIVSIEKDKLINNSFRPIKDLIYDLSHLEIVKIYNTMIKNKITALGVRTDCVLFEPNENIHKIFNFENVIGRYKL
jgi:hypothetical protein